jgi:integrase
MPQTPYRLARLVESKDHPWYIVFYVWNAQKGMLVRKKDYDVSKVYGISGKRAFAKKRIADINKLLEQGYHIDKNRHTDDKARTINFRKEYNVADAFKTALMLTKSTKRPATYNSYSSVAGIFVDFCRSHGWDKWPVKSLTKKDVLSFLDYAQVKGCNNTTRNKYGGYIKALMGLMVERGMLETNPASGIKKEPEETGRNIAYNADQVSKLKTAMIDHNKRLWLFVQFIYYGFIRPAELARLKVSMIDAKTRTINMPPAITKNRKPRHVRISPGLLGAILELKLEKCRRDHYVFGYNLETCDKPLQKNRASAAHQKLVERLDFGSDYTLYSWKHTGVVNHYKAGIDIKSLQQQLGHSNLQETSIYLKSLGLLADEAAFDKAPTL